MLFCCEERVGERKIWTKKKTKIMIIASSWKKYTIKTLRHIINDLYIYKIKYTGSLYPNQPCDIIIDNMKNK